MWYAIFFAGCLIALIGIAGVAITEYPKMAAQIKRDKATDEVILKRGAANKLEPAP